MLQPFHNLPVGPGAFWIGALVTVAFAGLARILRGVTPTGAVAGGGICFLLYACAGWGAFIALIAVFALTWIATRVGYRRKQAMGKAERRDGRTAVQVFSNLGIAAVFALLYTATHGNLTYLLAVAAALAEAAADTVASEVGQASGHAARLITTWKPVAAGTDGGISLRGTLAGIGAATIVSVVARITGWLPPQWTSVSVLGASAGMVVDSYLGALLQRRQLLTNDLVNLLGTLSAALIAILFAWIANVKIP